MRAREERERPAVRWRGSRAGKDRICSRYFGRSLQGECQNAHANGNGSGRFPEKNILVVAHGDTVAQFISVTHKVNKELIYQMPYCAKASAIMVYEVWPPCALAKICQDGSVW